MEDPSIGEFSFPAWRRFPDVIHRMRHRVASNFFSVGNLKMCRAETLFKRKWKCHFTAMEVTNLDFSISTITYFSLMILCFCIRKNNCSITVLFHSADVWSQIFSSRQLSFEFSSTRCLQSSQKFVLSKAPFIFLRQYQMLVGLVFTKTSRRINRLSVQNSCLHSLNLS